MDLNSLTSENSPLRLGQGNGAIGTPVAIQEEVEYGRVSLNNF